jgi:NAD(P)-dependent dehydrogenase (short-subunit alcohol dehydrogenase family)
MKLENAVVLVTGANRGLGQEFARQALAHGARKVYAGARDPALVTLPGVVPLRLDVNDPQQVAAAAAGCGDVTLVINNAGIASGAGLLAANGEDELRRLLETNLFGMLRVSQAFAPALAANGGGALINVLSAASWITLPRLAAYALTKTAAWSLTNGLRNELRQQGTQVLGLHVGFIDTDLARQVEEAKVAPAFVVERTYAALERGEPEVLVDALAQNAKRGLSADPAIYLDVPRLA